MMRAWSTLSSTLSAASSKRTRFAAVMRSSARYSVHLPPALTPFSRRSSCAFETATQRNTSPIAIIRAPKLFHLVKELLMILACIEFPLALGNTAAGKKLLGKGLSGQSGEAAGKHLALRGQSVDS